MIYFKEDYAKTGAKPHWGTRNSSFIKVAYAYKELGVKNFAFHLALYDQALVDVDPHDPNLDTVTIGKVMAECKRNPWYFFREVVRIPEQGGEPIMFEAHRANIAQIWLHMNNISQLDILPRQTGKTIGLMGLMDLYLYIFTATFDVGLMCKDTTLIHQNVSRMKQIRNACPPYFYKQGRSFNSDNMEDLRYTPSNKKVAKLITWTANADRNRADGHGRGGTFVLIGVDEFAHCVNIRYSLNSMIPACSTSFQKARKNGLPCSIVLATTPGYTSDKSGEFAFNFRGKCTRFTERMLDFENNEQLRQYVRKHSNGYVLVEYLAEMLGKDEEWFYFMKSQMEAEEYMRDVELKWIHGSVVSAITQAKLDIIRKNIREPNWLEERQGLTIKWFVPRDKVATLKSKHVLLGMDNSDNRGRDGTTLVMADPSTLEVYMTMHCNEHNLVFVANLVVDLLTDFRNALYIPESNRVAGILDIVMLRMEEEGLDPFTRIFNKFVDEKNSIHGHDLSLGSVRKQFGFTTSGASRQTLFKDVLSLIVDRAPSRIHDYDIWEEFSNLIKIKSRIDHPPGGHDDLTIAYLLCGWFVMFGRNIERYGFIPSEMASNLEGVDTSNKALINNLKEQRNMVVEKLAGYGIPMAVQRKYALLLQRIEGELERYGAGGKEIVSIHQNNPGNVHRQQLSSNDRINNMKLFRNNQL